MFNFLAKLKLGYYQQGRKPELLLLSGFHGDEKDVIKCVGSTIRQYKKALPDFLWIPAASPSAVAKGSRLNKNKADLNRQFFNGTGEEEAQIIMSLVGNYYFSLAISFHEDLDQKQFYLYDSHCFANEQNWHWFKDELLKHGVGLLDGVDDHQDPTLGCCFKNGYCSLKNQLNIQESGTFDVWVIKNKVVKRILTPEIPGQLSLSQKKKVVEAFFGGVILKEATFSV